MRRFFSTATTIVLLSLAAGPGAQAGELIRLAEWPLDTPAPAWPASHVMPVSAAVEVARYNPQEAAPPMAACAALPTACGTAPCQAAPCEDDCCFDFNVCCLPCRYFQADALLWHRVGTGCSSVLVIDTDNNAPLLNTEDLSFGVAPGMRFLVGWQPDGCSKCCAWEASYFGLFGWSATALVAGAGDLAIPGDLGLASNNFFNADFISANYESDLHNFELNCVKSCCPCEDTRLDFLCGFRYIFFNDNFTLTATDLQEGTSSYAIDADNNLLGVQLGGRMTQAWCRWAIELTGKAGVFYNDSHQHQLVTDFPNTPNPFVLRNSAGSDGSVAMLGELGVVLKRPINDCWSWRVGYSVLGLGGLALAPDQLDFTDTFTSGQVVNDSGWIFAHGGLLGVERVW